MQNYKTFRSTHKRKSLWLGVRQRYGTKSMTYKRKKNDKLGFIKIENLLFCERCYFRESKVKLQTQKYFYNHISNNRLLLVPYSKYNTDYSNLYMS